MQCEHLDVVMMWSKALGVGWGKIAIRTNQGPEKLLNNVVGKRKWQTKDMTNRNVKHTSSAALIFQITGTNCWGCSIWMVHSFGEPYNACERPSHTRTHIYNEVWQYDIKFKISEFNLHVLGTYKFSCWIVIYFDSLLTPANLDIIQANINGLHAIRHMNKKFKCSDNSRTFILNLYSSFSVFSKQSKPGFVKIPAK